VPGEQPFGVQLVPVGSRSHPGTGVAGFDGSALGPEPSVRGHAMWALGEIASSESLVALEALRSTEYDPFVLKELDGALARLRSKVK
jgi:hypothetical protein